MTEPSDTGRPAALAVVGAGPHALTLLAALQRLRPDLLARTVVLDPSGTWLARWREQFERLEIRYLRSPVVHHPHPDVYAIHHHHDLRDDDIGPGPYPRPSQRIFLQVVDELVAELGDAARVTPRAVVAIEPSAESTRLLLDDGSSLLAAHAVLSTNAHPRVGGPWGARDEPDVRDVSPGDEVVVLGGGLTAAQLVEQAMARDASVTMVTRRALVAREFDVDPGWMGPKHLDPFGRVANPVERVRLALAARGGGTVPPLVLDELRAHADAGRIRLVEGTAAVAVEPLGDRRCVTLTDGSRLHADRVVAPLGSRLDVTADPLLGPLVASGAVGAAGPVPVLDRSLRLPGTRVHVMGRLAIAELGPAAGNLSGARWAAERITDHLRTVPLGPDVGVSVGRPPD